MKVAVILPSRGLIFSKTAEEVLANVKDIPHKFFFAHKMPIPDCFELPTSRALAYDDITHLWFVEDDMVLPPHTLQDMLDKDLAVVTVNYPTTKKGNASILSVKGQLIYGGTGCTLVKREVFSEMKAPYWRTDILYIPKNLGNCIRFTAQKRKGQDGYGYHDVHFFMNLFRLGIPAHKLDYSVGQRKLVALGKSGSNDGAHKIEEWHKVREDRYFDLIKNLPVQEAGKLIEVETSTGRILAEAGHAKRLIKAGLAKRPPKRAVVLDDSEIL